MVNFTKMQGIGDDYVYVDCFKEKVEEPGKTVRFISDRRFGIGSDGLILICPSDAADCGTEMYNASGSQGVMCGNGVCCVGKYVYDHGPMSTDRRQITVETLEGIKNLDLGILDGKVVPIMVDTDEAFLTSELPEDIAVDGTDYRFMGIDVGDPHTVYYIEEIDSLDLEKIGPASGLHERFQPHRVNMEFIQVMDRGHLRMCVRERGSGETWACGTGATASVMASILMGYVDDQMQVSLRGGNLQIRLGRGTGHLFIIGPTVEVFSGSINIPREIYCD